VIEAEKAPKFSDPFDRAQYITSQLNQILTALGKLEGKLDAFEGRLYHVESEGRLSRFMSIAALVVSVAAFVIGIVALVTALSA
jgi:hypothetical protein